MDKWITASEITAWATAQSRSCQQTLPELVRRLILATATSINRLDFPCDDSVTTGGWDGHLETLANSAYFPNGISGWEMGVAASAATKAGEDYKKRTGNSLGLDKKEVTFVFVTPRSWPNRKAWEVQKRKEKKWKEVRVIAADELEAWLASAPAVALWLARKIGKLAQTEIRGIEHVWEEWSCNTQPAMTTDMVIGGRRREVDIVHTWANGSPDTLEVQGDSPDEAFAFLYASISELPEESRIKALSRCVVVGDLQQFRACIQTFSTPLIIAAPADCSPAAGHAKSKGHHVFLSVDSKTAIDAGGRAVRLPRPQRDALEKALKAAGLSEIDTQRHLKDSGRSIAVLRRRLSTLSIVQKPAWIESTPVSVLNALLLAGTWNIDKEGDRNVLEKLSGMKSTELDKSLEKLTTVDDSPVRRVGNVWMLKAPLDAWFLAGRTIDTDWLKRFEQVIHSVLTETDPKYDLSPDKRWAASIHGKSSQYSEWIRRGLVESLVLIAVHGGRITSSTVDSQAFVNSVVKDVLSNSKTWEAWASLKDITSLLAEAAPEAFMDALDEKIRQSPSIFTDLMSDDGTTFGECRHSGLLWALEGLSWNPEYFTRAFSILTALAKIDKGGHWSNRAKNSLKDLFLPGLPQTNASASQRLEAFDSLMSKEPEMAWKISESFMHGSVSPSHQFRWRDNGGSRTGLDYEPAESHKEYVTGIHPRVAKLSYATKENLIESVQSFVNSTPEIRKAVLDALKKANPKEYSPEERSKLRANLRQVLNWVNGYGGKDFSPYRLPLVKALKRFEPEDVIERVGWLVADPWARMPEGEKVTDPSRDRNVLNKRKKAARELLDNASLEQIFKFSKTVQYIYFLGDAIGRAIADEKEEAKVLDTMLKSKEIHHHLISGFSQGRVAVTDSNWVSKQVKKLKKRGTYSARACALLYLGLPEGAKLWDEVKAQGQDVEKEYWKEASGFSKEDSLKDSEIAVEKLLDANRPSAALQIAGNHRNTSMSSTLLQRLLNDLLSSDPEKQKNPMDSWYIEGVFQQLHARNELSLEEIAKLEWPFVKVLDRYNKGTLTLAIHRVLQKDPSFFTQLVDVLYKRSDRKEDPEKLNLTKEQRETVASNAWEILHDWYLTPGLNSDGSLDEKKLTDWVEAARKQCAAIDKTIGCDLQISNMLARTPADPDGAWPHISVRNLIENLKNQTIEEHIPIGIYNDRGVTSRGMGDGGSLERNLAKKYLDMSKKVGAKWPRTASILRSLAESYERDAKRWDVDSDLNDVRFG